MAITASVTATPQTVRISDLPGGITLHSNGAADVYYRRNDASFSSATTFIGNAAALAALAHGLVRSGDTVTLGDWQGIELACATGLTASVTLASGLYAGRTPSRNYLYEIAEGHIGGHYPLHIFGYNGDLDNVREDVWEAGGRYVFPAAAGIQMQFDSTSVEDDILTGGAIAGTGVHKILLHYLDANLAEQTEEVTLNGQGEVNTTAENIRRVQSMHVTEAGTGAAAAGTITLKNTGATVKIGRASCRERV